VPRSRSSYSRVVMIFKHGRRYAPSRLRAGCRRI